NPAGDLEIGCIVAALARDEGIRPRLGRREVVAALTAAHHPRLDLDGLDLELAALEDPVVRARMQLEAPVEPLVVAVERVRIFHYELADADETRAGPRLVAVLGLEVVEHLRQVAVRLDLARVEGGCLLVRHRQDELSVVPIAEL